MCNRCKFSPPPLWFKQYPSYQNTSKEENQLISIFGNVFWRMFSKPGYFQISTSRKKKLLYGIHVDNKGLVDKRISR